MRPNRIIVGEGRGAEAVDMSQAMNTGHDGSLSTVHANTAIDALARLETMMLMGSDIPIQAIRRQITSGIDIIVHLGRMRDHSRKVLEIVELEGTFDDEFKFRKLYEFQERDDEGIATGKLLQKEELLHVKKMRKIEM